MIVTENCALIVPRQVTW